MADTQRSLAELIALLATNNTGGISAQDMRDLITSVAPPHGGYYLTSAVQTAIAAINTWTPADGVFTELPVVSRMSHTVNGQIRYDGDSPRHLHIVASLSVTAASNNQLIDVAITKNGTPLPGFLGRKIATGADVGSIAVHADAMLSDTDYLEICFRNLTSSANITMTHGYMFAMGMLM